MRIRRFGVPLGTVLLITAPLWVSHLVWRSGQPRQVKLVVVDYSVPSVPAHGHTGLFWLLNHLRLRPPGYAGEWELARDYIGPKPEEPAASRYLHQVQSEGAALAAADWLYVADAYGVFEPLPPGADPLAPRRRLFGGLGWSDAQVLRRHVERGGHLVVEFNTFCGAALRGAGPVVEALVGVHWTGWTGTFLSDPADPSTVPRWLPARYAARFDGASLPPGPALLLLHRDGRMLLLSGAPFHLSVPVLRVTDAGMDRYPGAYGRPAYFSWFAIVVPERRTEVLAELTLPTPADWDERLAAEGVPTVFPLLTRLDAGRSRRFYLAANLSHLHERPGWHFMAWLPLIQAAIHRRRDESSERPAFWAIFVPLMGAVLRSEVVPGSP